MTRPTSAMIFAAGFGTRMGHLTAKTPKPMVELGGEPMIARTIRLLREAGIERIVANTHYLAEVIEPYLHAYGVTTVREEPAILETGGGLKAALAYLGDGAVITINPDGLWLGQNPVCTLLDAWRPEMNALLLLADPKRTFGSASTGDFSLKDGLIARNGPHVYSGAQIIDPSRLHEIEADAFSLNLYWDLLALNQPLAGAVHDGPWCDIGNPEGLKLAEGMAARD